MFDVDNIEGTDLEEVSKILTNMCQEKVDILNIKGCLPRRCIMHYFPIIPTCARPFLTNKDESFDHDLTSQLSEIIKANNLVRNSSLPVGSPMQRTFNALFFASANITTKKKKKSRHSALGHGYEGISDILRRKSRYIRKHL